MENVKDDNPPLRSNALFGGVSVLLQMWCSGEKEHDKWEQQFAKLVEMPALLPIGSEVFPTDKIADGADDEFEWLGFRVKRYLWCEGEPFVRCDLEEACDEQPCSLEEFRRDIERRGWRLQDDFG